MVERVFCLSKYQTTVGREVQAGVTTFAAMAYILAVNPALLAAAGMDQAALLTVTALAAALGTLLMAGLTNYPVALAPGMGLNAFFAFTVCGVMGVPWQSALGLVFVNGVLFFLLSVTGLRSRLVEAIPESLKLAITVGIGLFIALLGFKNGGLLVAHPATFITAGDWTSPPVLLVLGGLGLTFVLIQHRVPGAILWGIVAMTATGLMVPSGEGMFTVKPEAVFSVPPSPMAVMGQLDFGFLLTDFRAALPVVLALLFVDLFDTMGTLIGVTKRAGLTDAAGNLPKLGRALTADSLATVGGALLGTSTTTSYVESAAGVEAGGRTGLTGVVTAGCFLAVLGLSPLLLSIPVAATAPALIVVGIYMAQSVLKIDWEDFSVAAPAFLTVAGMPFGFSISHGIGLGLVAHVVILASTGRAGELKPWTWGLGGLFALHYFTGWV